MGAVLFRCPTTGQNVQGWFADEGAENGGNGSYETVTCAACGWHLVNPQTGETLGSEEE